MDNKKLAMLIIGKKKKEDVDNSDQYDNGQMSSEAKKEAMEKFMEAIADDSVDRALKHFANLVELCSNEEDKEED